MDIIRTAAVEIHTASLTLEATAACFHPHDHFICLAMENYVFVYDLIGLGLVRKLFVPERVKYIAILCSHNFLVACGNEGSIFVWEFYSMKEIASFTAREDKTANTLNRKKPVVCFAYAQIHPVIFYSKQGSTSIICFDLAPKTLGKFPPKVLDARKPVSNLACHPSKPLVASFSTDGFVRIWDYQTQVIKLQSDDFMSVGKQKSIVYAPPNFLTFHPTEEYLIAAGVTGLLICWKIGNNLTYLGSGRVTGQIASVSFHPFLPFFFTMSTEGELLSWKIGTDVDNFFVSSGWTKSANVLDIEVLARYGLSVESSAPLLKAQSLLIHPKLNYLTFTYMRQLRHNDLAMIYVTSPLRHGIYSLFDCLNPTSALPLVSPLTLPCAEFFSQEELVFHYPPEMYYISGGDILSYSIQLNDISFWKKKLPDKNQAGTEIYPLKIVFSAQQQKFLVFFQPPSCPLESCFCILTTSSQPDPISLRPGKDGFFLGEKEEELLILSADGKTIEIFSLQKEEKMVTLDLNMTIERIFISPRDGYRAIVYYDSETSLIFASSNHHQLLDGTAKYLPDMTYSFQLQKNESVCQVIWQYNQSHPCLCVAAVHTTRGVRLISDNFSQEYAFAQLTREILPINSCFWVDWALLFTTNSQLHYLTLDGFMNSLCSLKDTGTVLSGVLNDRVLFTHKFKNQVRVRWHAVGLLEPLMMGLLGIVKQWNSQLGFSYKEHLAKLINRFDSTRISLSAIDYLDQNGHPDVAFALIAGSSFHSWSIKSRLALHSHQFDTAFEILHEAFTKEKNPDSSVVSMESEFYNHFRQLAAVCIYYGQFDLTRKCYELLDDDFSLLQLFVVTKNKDGLEYLLQKTKSNPVKSMLALACEKQLKLRGGEFKNEKSVSGDWNFITDQSTNWYPAQITSATMKISKNAKGFEDFIQPLGFLDTIQKWLAYPINIDDGSYPDFESVNITTPFSTDQLTARYSASFEPSDDDPLQRLNETPKRKQFPEQLVVPAKPTSSRTRGLCSTSSITKRESFPSLFVDIENDFDNSSFPATFVAQELGNTSDDEDIDGARKRPKSDEILPKSAMERGQHHFIIPPRPPPPPPLLSIESTLNFEAQDSDESPIEQVNKFMTMGLNKLDKGLFPAALDDINQSIKELSGDGGEKKSQLRTCVAYKLALKLLIEIKLLEKSKNIQRIALLTRFLSEVPIRPYHRVICMRFALYKNLEAENYGVAARFIKLLRRRDVADKAELDKLLKKCKEKKYSNAVPLTTTEDEYQKVRFCFQSFVPLVNCSIVHCPYCDAVYSEKAKKSGEVCVFCTLGSLRRFAPGTLPAHIP